MERRTIIAVIVGILVVALVVTVLNPTGNVITAREKWDHDWCSEAHPCPNGEGDCDKTYGQWVLGWGESEECKTGWCRENVGLYYGQTIDVDVCECREGTQWDPVSETCI